jgi:hypothetical protein
MGSQDEESLSYQQHQKEGHLIGFHQFLVQVNAGTLHEHGGVKRQEQLREHI